MSENKGLITAQEVQLVSNAIAALEEALSPFESKLRSGMCFIDSYRLALIFARQLNAHVTQLRDLAESCAKIEKFENDVIYKRKVRK